MGFFTRPARRAAWARVSWEALTEERVRTVPTKDEEDFIELEGTPDWVLEIISPSSRTKDTVKLRQRYHQAGIPEYWLIDARGDDLVFEILRREAAEYRAVARKGGWLKSRVFGKQFRLLRTKDRLGNPAFRLEMK